VDPEKNEEAPRKNARKSTATRDSLVDGLWTLPGQAP
jgi:hypothetical protein